MTIIMIVSAFVYLIGHLCILDLKKSRNKLISDYMVDVEKNPNAKLPKLSELHIVWLYVINALATIILSIVLSAYTLSVSKSKVTVNNQARDKITELTIKIKQLESDHAIKVKDLEKQNQECKNVLKVYRQMDKIRSTTDQD